MRLYSTSLLPAIAAVSGTILLSACGGGGGSDSVTVAGSGTLKVSMTDAPACGFDKVNVSVSKVRAHKSTTAADADAGWSEIVLNPARKIDLLSLTNGLMTELGQTTLPSGHYTQMRLVLSENGGGALANSVIPTGSTNESALDTPSATQSGIKLNGEFDVAANTTTDLVLDFDACKSVVTKGNGGFALKPVISVTAKAVSGAINGFVTPGTPNAVVSVQQNGVVVKSTIADTTGAFTLSPVPASTSYVVVLTANGRTTAAVTGVPVTTGSSTVLSTSAAPISLPTASVATVSGNALPATAQATVRALQTLLGGVPIEVMFKGADAVTGAYTMSLPTAVPQVGKFGQLPIVFAADQTAVAGKYTLEASATGFAKQTSEVNISQANVSKSFTLVP
jgi:hypothetical protein